MNSHVDDAVMAEINITPFTDVLLVLLIIFMILAAIEVPPGFQKQLDEPSSRTKVASQEHPIEVAIARSGWITIDGAPTTPAHLYPDLASAVRAHVSRGESKHIALTSDKDATYDNIIKVLDAARQASDNDVGFVTY